MQGDSHNSYRKPLRFVLAVRRRFLLGSSSSTFIELSNKVLPAAEFGFSTVFLWVASIDVGWRKIAPDNAGFDKPKIIVEQWLQAEAPEPPIRKLQAVDVLVLREHGVRANKRQKSVEYTAAFGFGHEA